MKQFTGGSSIISRVTSIIKADVESQGEAWLLALGYAACNDYAQSVVNRAAFCVNGTQHVRFETVARYVRTAKTRIKTRNAAATIAPF